MHRIVTKSRRMHLATAGLDMLEGNIPSLHRKLASKRTCHMSMANNPMVESSPSPKEGWLVTGKRNLQGPKSFRTRPTSPLFPNSQTGAPMTKRHQKNPLVRGHPGHHAGDIIYPGSTPSLSGLLSTFFLGIIGGHGTTALGRFK